MTAAMWKWTNSASHSPMPDTAMAFAFMRAVYEWSARQAGARTIVLPTGAVDGEELKSVVVALTCARSER